MTASPDIPERWGTAGAGAGEAREHPSRRELVDRSRSRAWALQVHYLWESEGRSRSLRDTFVAMLTSRRIAKRRLPRIRELVRTLDEHLAAVDEAIEESLDNWRLDRLSSIDRGILRLGTTEILFMDEIPPKATIQEALGIAEAYGGNESRRFVNGVLDAVWKKRGGEGPAAG